MPVRPRVRYCMRTMPSFVEQSGSSVASANPAPSFRRRGRGRERRPYPGTGRPWQPPAHRGMVRGMVKGVDRTELADFLRHCRARVAPADVGLSHGARRRTPGLRREEVAQLAGMSTDHYTRLEQARGSRPSRQMLAAVARALRLTGDERDHLFHLAGEEPPRDRPT